VTDLHLDKRYISSIVSDASWTIDETMFRPEVLNVFFTFLPYKPEHCQYLPTKIAKR